MTPHKQLFRHRPSPEQIAALVGAAKLAVKFAEDELDVRVDSFCRTGTDGKRDMASADKSESCYLSEATLVIGLLRAALAPFGGG